MTLELNAHQKRKLLVAVPYSESQLICIDLKYLSLQPLHTTLCLEPPNNEDNTWINAYIFLHFEHCLFYKSVFYYMLDPGQCVRPDILHIIVSK